MSQVMIERMIIVSALGFDPREARAWSEKWRQLKVNAKQKGNTCLLSFDQYVTIAKESGLKSVSEIGTSIDSYQMGRIGDVGNYEVGSCRFITHRKNLQERRENGGDASGASNRVDKLKGQTKHTMDGFARMANANSRDFKATHESGLVVEGRNLREFCKENDLNVEQMYLICAGKRKTAHKGWKGEYV